MSDKFSQLLPVLGAIVAFLFAALLLVYIVRLVFGRRIRAPGARNRPRRLDIVDVFDLDKERQLVIVRRDNTEHLLLIGGPNDVLVEGAISRVEGMQGRAETGRAEATRPLTPQNWPAGPIVDEDVAPVPVKPAAPTGINLPPEMIAPKPLAPKPAPTAPLPPRPVAPPTAAETAAAAPPPASAPVAPKPPGQPAPPLAPRPTPAAPPPLRPAATQRPAPPPFLARTQQVIKPRADEGQESGEPEARSAPPLPPRPAAPPPLRPAAPPPPPLRPAAPPAQPATPSAGELPRPPAPPRAQAEDALESLEEEMARLLGRPEKE